MRMIDQILAEGIKSLNLSAWAFGSSGSQPKSFLRRYVNALREAPVCVVDNIAKYMWEDCDEENWTLTKNVPQITIPFKQFWMELRLPKRVRSLGKVTEIKNSWARYGGALFEFERVKDVIGQKFLPKEAERVSGDHWVSRAYTVVSNPQGITQPGPVNIAVFDPEGKPEGDGIFSFVAGSKRMSMPPEDGGEKALSRYISSIPTCCMLALSFLACKNVEVEEVKPHRKKQREHSKKSKAPLVKYKVLKITQANKATGGNGTSKGEERPFHICRGHFKEYTEEKPLFGKFTGMYWWSPHTRGRRKHGTIVKDYEVG